MTNNKHAKNMRAALALCPHQIAMLFGSGKIEAAADELDRLEAREHKTAVLIKAALDAATALDEIKLVATLNPEERERAQQIVERTYDACEALGAQIGIAEAAA